MADVPLMSNPMTTAEDLVVGGASGAPVRLPVGSNGDVLSVSAGAVAWAAAAGGGLGDHGVRVYNSGNITVASTLQLPMDSERRDTDGYHFTSAAALTGTVTKTATSTGLVGVGTSFTTELSVGQMISVPGTAAEKRIVTVITDNTNLTVSVAFANTAAGQTATRVNTPLVVPAGQAGVYLMGASVEWAAAATGYRLARFLLNGATILAAVRESGPSASFNANQSLSTIYSLAEFDYVELEAVQNAGSNRTVNAAANYSPEFWMQRVA